MLDKDSRDRLREKLRGITQKASSKVITEVKAEQGDFKVVLSAKQIDHFYKNEKIASIPVNELDDDIIQYIQSDSETCVSMMLNEFVDGFNTEAFEKTAAHSTQNEQTYQRIQEKQLDEQKVALHPRENDSYRNITEKQMPEHNERHGAPVVTTEAQLKTTTTTPKGEALEAGKRRNEDRNIITEEQFSQVADQASKQGEIGSVFTGDQDHMITDKQIEELLSHQGWEEPRFITERQLSGQDGELSRLTAESASKMLKEAFNAFGKTVLALGVTPDEVLETLSDITSHSTKEASLSSILVKGQKTDDVNTAVNRARYHGKVASVTSDKKAIASAVLRQIANIDGDSAHKSAMLFSLSTMEDMVQKIAAASDTVLKNKEVKPKAQMDQNDPKYIFASALKNENKFHIEGSADDGMYQYSGKLSEVDEDPSDSEKFAEKAFEYSKIIVAENSNIKSENLTPISLDVDQEKGTFDLIMKDASTLDQKQIKARAEKRAKLAKEAQVPAGGMTPGSGDMGGGELGQVSPPPGAADMAGAPVESLGGGLDTPGEEPGAGAGGEPTPPGTKCPACGSDDVDVDNGDIRCNSCGAEGDISVNININKWPDTIEETDKEEAGPDEGFELGGDLEEAGMEEGGMAPPNIPVAASIHLKPTTLTKLAEKKIKLGSVCPNCGSGHSDLMEGEGICYDCNTEYKIALYTQKNKPYKLAARVTWTPAPSIANPEECDGCNRIKSAFKKALEDYGMNFSEFRSLASWKERGDTILKMAKAGVLGKVQKALEDKLPLHKIAQAVPARWKGYESVDKFPIDSCKERLNRRFGENASAMSGPCQGKKLADCVCGQLQSLGIYSDGLAAKVANTQMSNDPQELYPTEECIGTMKNEGFRLAESGLICDCLKAAYASYEDLLIEAVVNHVPTKNAKTVYAQFEDDIEISETPDEMDVIELDEAPGDLDITEDLGETAEIEEVPDVTLDEEMGIEDLGNDTVDITLTLDKGTAEEIYQAIDSALNENSLGEELGEEEVTDIVDVDTPEEEATETIEEELSETPEEQEAEEEAGVEETIPGLDEEATEEEGVLIKETVDEKPCSKPMEMEVEVESKGDGIQEAINEIEEAVEKIKEPEKNEVKEEISEEKKESPVEEKEEKEEPEEKEDDEDENEKEASLDNLLLQMKKGTITKESTGVSNMIDHLIKAAQDAPEKFKYLSEKSKKTKEQAAQDSTDVKYKDGGKIGHEEAFSAKTPDVPRKNQLLGTEGKEMTVNDTGDMPSIPAGSEAMKGEENYRPEKQTEVDPNQGSISTTAGAEVMNYKVAQGHKMYDGLAKLAKAGQKTVTCNDGTEYEITAEDQNTFILTAKGMKGKCKKCGKPNFICRGKCDGTGPKNEGKKDKEDKTEEKNDKKEKNEKEAKVTNKKAQVSEVKVRNVETVEDDPDINQSSGPGKGKVKSDQSMGEEPKPSEGVAKPNVPTAPNKGQLSREETVNNSLDMPEIPAGGGQNANYDQNEKNAPEKQDEMIGKQNPPLSANTNVDIKKEATRIAGEMLTHGKIKPNQLDDQITHLSQLTMPLLKQYEEDILKKAETNYDAGLEKTASINDSETAFVVPSSTPLKKQGTLADKIQGLMTLNQRNSEFEKYRNDQGNLDVFK